MIPRLLRLLADLGWALAAKILNWLLGPPPPPGTTCPDFIPQWVLDECAEWRWDQ